ncbi:unnamed protein product, partial [Adineta steineri]
MSTIPRNQIEQGREDESSSLHSSNVPSRRYNLDNIDIDESPMKSTPYHFQPGSIIHPTTFQQVLNEVIGPVEEGEEHSDIDEDHDKMMMMMYNELFNETNFDKELERDLHHLSQFIQ